MYHFKLRKPSGAICSVCVWWKTWGQIQRTWLFCCVRIRGISDRVFSSFSSGSVVVEGAQNCKSSRTYSKWARLIFIYYFRFSAHEIIEMQTVVSLQKFFVLHNRVLDQCCVVTVRVAALLNLISNIEYLIKTSCAHMYPQSLVFFLLVQ